MEKPEAQPEEALAMRIRFRCLEIAVASTIGFRHESPMDVVACAAEFEHFVLNGLEITFGQSEAPSGE